MKDRISFIRQIRTVQHGRMVSDDAFEKSKVVEVDGAAEADYGVDHPDFVFFFLFLVD